MTQAWPVRLTHAAFIDAAGGVATIASSLGGVLSVVRNGAGDYSVTLKYPGVPGFAAHSPVPLATVVGTTFGAVVIDMESALVLRARVFDAAGVAADASFVFGIFTTERVGPAT